MPKLTGNDTCYAKTEGLAFALHAQREPERESQSPTTRGTAYPASVAFSKIFSLTGEHIVNIEMSWSSSSSFYVYIVFVQISYCITRFPVSIACREVQCAVVLISSLQPIEVLHHREVTIDCCQVQWCPVIHIPRLLVSPSLAQILPHRGVTL